MRKLSLRLRITLLVGGLLVLLTTALTIFSILGANHYFVTPQLLEGVHQEMNKAVLSKEIPNSSPDADKGPINSISTQANITAAQKGFSLQSVAALIAIIIFGLGITYWIMGRALRPLTVLSETIHDINEYNLSKSIELQTANDEVGSITVSFNGMLGRLRNSFEQQKRFAASAAHELKTPLATMKTSLQVLGMDDSPSSEDYRDTISVVEQSVDWLISTVNDLLLLSSEGRAELDDEISLCMLFCKIVEELGDAICSKNLFCTIPQNDCVVTGNRMLLRSAFFNLFENAVKYNRDGGTVEVLFQKTSTGKTSISICDTGIGMTEEELAFVFEPLYRTDRSRAEQIPGNGLGLPIIQTIIDRHGGEINIESKIGVGTKVIVVL